MLLVLNVGLLAPQIRHEILSLKVPNVEFAFDVPDDISMLGFRH